MEDEERNLEIMSKVDNYNRWIYNNLRKYIGKRVLEVGCGIGTMTSFFAGKEFVMGVDINEDNLSVIKKKFSDSRNRGFINYDLSEGYEGLKEHDFDTIVCINVLEHIKNDQKTVQHMHNLLKKGGKAVLMVPAFPALYGTIDKADNHYRRYSKKRVVMLLEKAGFKIKKARYMNIPGFFGWYYHNKIKKIKVHTKSDLSLFNKLIPLFESFERLVPPLFGLSLIAIGEKMGDK